LHLLPVLITLSWATPHLYITCRTSILVLNHMWVTCIGIDMTWLCVCILELITARRTKVPGNYYLASSEDQTKHGMGISLGNMQTIIILLYVHFSCILITVCSVQCMYMVLPTPASSEDLGSGLEIRLRSSSVWYPAINNKRYLPSLSISFFTWASHQLNEIHTQWWHGCSHVSTLVLLISFCILIRPTTTTALSLWYQFVCAGVKKPEEETHMHGNRRDEKRVFVASQGGNADQSEGWCTSVLCEWKQYNYTSGLI